MDSDPLSVINELLFSSSLRIRNQNPSQHDEVCGVSSNVRDLNKKVMKLTPKIMAINIRKTCGRTLSHTSTSLEKRLMILPSGVMSKNVIGKRKTALRRMECIPFAAAIVPSENVNDTMNCATTTKLMGP